MDEIKDIKSVKWIPVNMMKTISEYQRSCYEPWIRKTMPNFNWMAFGLIEVYYDKYSEKYKIIDGQHRVIMAERLGLASIPCNIRDISTDEEAAKIAIIINNRRNHKASDEFKMGLCAGDETCLSINDIVKKNGLKLTPTGSGTDNISCYSELTKLFVKYGGAILDESLYLIKKTWEGDSRTLGRKFISGFTEFLSVYKGRIKIDVLVTKFNKIPIPRIIESANMFISLKENCTKAYAKTFVLSYNMHRRVNRLDEQKIIK